MEEQILIIETLPTLECSLENWKEHFYFSKKHNENFEMIVNIFSNWSSNFIFKGQYKLNIKITETINEDHFLEFFFSRFPEDWQNNPKYVLAIFFVYVFHDVFQNNKQHKNIFKNNTDKFLESLKTLNEISLYNFYKFRGSIYGGSRYYFEIIYIKNYDYGFIKLSNSDIFYLVQKYGIKFVASNISKISSILCRKKNKTNAAMQTYFMELLKNNYTAIDEKRLDDEVFIEFFENNIIPKDFYFQRIFSEIDRRSFNLFNETFFTKVVSIARNFDTNKDFFTIFLHKIDYSRENIIPFISNVPENGYPVKDMIIICNRYLYLNENLNSLINIIKSVELFSYLIGSLESFSKIIFLAKSSNFVKNTNITIKQLMELVTPININTILLQGDIHSITYLNFINMFVNYDLHGLFCLAKCFGKEIDKFIYSVDNIDTERDHYEKSKIIAVTCGMLKVKVIYCILNRVPIQIALSGRNATNKEIANVMLDLHTNLYGDGFDEYSFIHVNKSFKISYTYLGIQKRMCFVGSPFKVVKPIDETIEFGESYERTYVELHNRFIGLELSNFDETIFRDFIAFFREHYAKNREDYDLPFFHFKHFYNCILLAFDSNIEIQNKFIEETMQFISSKYLDILQTEKYIERMKSFKAEEKAEKEISSIIQKIKRNRDNDELFKSCQEMLQDSQITPAIKKICDNVQKMCQELFVYKYLAQNPNAIMKCPVCIDLLKNTAFISFNCGHNCCAGCSTHTKICPVCRMAITTRTPVHQNDPIDEELMKKMSE